MKYILVVGGEWNNKGAQAMLFVTVTELAKRFPDREICAVVPPRLIEQKQDSGEFKFKLISDIICRGPALYTLGGKWRFIAFKKREKLRNMLYAKKIWENTEYVFDISGYAIGKKWGPVKSARGAMIAALAKKVGAKCYFLPQSFGPFDFNISEKEQKIYDELLKDWLSKADVICAREKVGKQMLEERYNLQNVRYMPDIVLQNKEYNLKSIYDNAPEIRTLDVKKRSVALIPNKHVTKMKNNDGYQIWEEIIRQLLTRNYNVYLLVHSGDDVEVIKKLKDIFKDREEVILVEEDFSCIEYDLLVSKFDYLVASRYHSIVHAYRRSVPCIVLGWADKYEVLLEDMNQLPYMFDLREKISMENVCKAMDDMEVKRDENAKVIGEKVKKIQEDSIFDNLL